MFKNLLRLLRRLFAPQRIVVGVMKRFDYTSYFVAEMLIELPWWYSLLLWPGREITVTHKGGPGFCHPIEENYPHTYLRKDIRLERLIRSPGYVPANMKGYPCWGAFTIRSETSQH